MGIFSKIIGGGEKYFLALDIGTDLVKALVFKTDKKVKKGVIVGVGSARQKLGNMQSGAVSNIAGVIETSQEAIEAAKAEAGVKKVKNAVIGIAGELVKGTTTMVHYERVNQEIKIGVDELKDIIQKVQFKAYERIRNQIAKETNQNDIEVKLINAAIVDVKIDGYPVSNPFNFQGKRVSIGVFNAYAPLMHLGALQTIADALNIELISIVAEPYAVARSIDYEGEFDFNAIFIDIGGGTTDIAVVRNGGLEGTSIFALGGQAFTKRLASELRTTFEKAEELKILYSANKLNLDLSARIQKIVKEDALVWLGGVEIALSEFSENELLPHRIFLCGGGAALPEIKEVLLSFEWTRNLPFSREISVNFLQPQNILRLSDATGKLLTPQYFTPLGLANLVLDLEGEEKMMAEILKKAMREVQKQ